MSGEFERTVRQGLSAARWILAPMYLGLALLLLVLLVLFVRDFFRHLPLLFQKDALAALPVILTLGIVLLAAHVVLIVVQSGYQLLSPVTDSQSEPRDGAGRLDFTKLRNRLLAASTVLALLMIFRILLILPGDAETGAASEGLWPIGGMLALLVGSALVLAIADWFGSLADRTARAPGDQNVPRS